MTLVPCPECKKMISHEASSCPKCGQPLKSDWGEKKARQEESAGKKLKWLFILLGIGFLILLSSVGGNDDKIEASEYKIEASEYGKNWGFTVDRLTVSCHRWTYPNGTVRPHVLIEANGMMYGLNGAAMGSGNYRNAREIMIRDKNGLFMAKGPGEVIERGLRLCER